MKKILIVEDDAIVRQVYQTKFKMEGFEVETAMDGKTAIEALRHFQPAVVLLDLMMPGISGIEVLKFIRSQPQLRSTPVVVFTNSYLGNMVQEAWKAGATKCLLKADCTPQVVAEVVRKTIEPLEPRPAVQPPPAPVAPATPDFVQQFKSVRAHKLSAGGSGKPTDAAIPSAAAGGGSAPARAEVASVPPWQSPGRLNAVRSLWMECARTKKTAEQRAKLTGLQEAVRAIYNEATVAGAEPLVHFSHALELLIQEVQEKPKNFTPSTTRTLAQAVDFLGVLLEHRDQAVFRWEAPPRILAVDDETISGQMISMALEKVGLASLLCDHSLTALQYLSEQSFDLVFLDIDMPELDGFQLCQKLRTLPQHAKTPVVFVTALSGFESRAKSILSGGNDLIAKPFLLIELGVKALMSVMHAQAARSA